MKTKIFQWLLLVCKFVQFIVGLLPGDDGDTPGDSKRGRREGGAKEEEEGKEEGEGRGRRHEKLNIEN